MKAKFKIKTEAIHTTTPKWLCVGEEETLTEEEVLAVNRSLESIAEARKIIDPIFKAAEERFNAPKNTRRR
jgi:hypothetical protein